MTELNMLYYLLGLSQEEMKITLTDFAEAIFNKKDLTITDSYIFCKGNYPILLVAHMDTIYDHSFYSLFYDNDFAHNQSKKKIFFDSSKKVIWSPEGLGADDRAGLFIIIKLLLAGLRPYVLFTTDEEIGGKGARQFAEDFKDASLDKFINFIVELDRKGKNDAVYYDCNNELFQSYINSFGFIPQLGTFSDICIISPILNIAGVNLSVGYYNEHCQNEYLSLLQNDKIYDIIYYMVKESKKLEKGFSYFTENDNTERCICCGLSFPKIQMKLYHNNFLCKDCLSFL